MYNHLIPAGCCECCNHTLQMSMGHRHTRLRPMQGIGTYWGLTSSTGVRGGDSADALQQSRQMTKPIQVLLPNSLAPLQVLYRATQAVPMTAVTLAYCHLDTALVPYQTTPGRKRQPLWLGSSSTGMFAWWVTSGAPLPCNAGTCTKRNEPLAAKGAANYAVF